MSRDLQWLLASVFTLSRTHDSDLLFHFFTPYFTEVHNLPTEENPQQGDAEIKLALQFGVDVEKRYNNRWTSVKNVKTKKNKNKMLLSIHSINSRFTGFANMASRHEHVMSSEEHDD